MLCECQRGGLQVTRRRVQARARELLVEELEELGTLAQDEDVVWLGSGTLVPAWFDPSGEAAVRVPPNASSDTVDILREFSPLAGLLGILPPGLDEVLSWKYVGGGYWRRRELGPTKDLMGEIQRALMWGGLCVWSARCRAMDTWWSSGGAAVTRAKADLIAEIGRRAYVKAGKADLADGGRAPGRKRSGRIPPRGSVDRRAVLLSVPAKASVAANRPRRGATPRVWEGPAAFFVRRDMAAIGARDEARERAEARMRRQDGCAWY